MKRECVFKTEAELCAAFIFWAKREGYTAYPETAGFDVLLVSAEGWQVGVEAKLRLNVRVIAQALEFYDSDTGPDHRAVLVPSLDHDLRVFCRHVGLDIFYCTTLGRGRPTVWHNFARDDGHSGSAMFDWNPAKRCELPEYIPDVPAGVPHPVQLTPWKIGALKVLARIALSGTITRREISAYGIDSRAWCNGRGWLVPVSGSKRDGHWIRGESCPAFDAQHPETFERIKAELAAAGRVSNLRWGAA